MKMSDRNLFRRYFAFKRDFATIRRAARPKMDVWKNTEKGGYHGGTFKSKRGYPVCDQD